MTICQSVPHFGHGRAWAVFLLLSVLAHLLLLAVAGRIAPPSAVIVPARPLALTLSIREPAVESAMPPAARGRAAEAHRPAGMPRVRRLPASSAVARTPAPDLGPAAIRAAAGAVIREQNQAAARGKAGRLPAETPAPAKSALQQSLESSARPDCRQAYSGMGLLAIVPLALDTATDRGCRW